MCSGKVSCILTGHALLLILSYFIGFSRFEDDVIEERRKCAVTLLEFIGNHPPLFTSNVFVKFFEVITL